MSAIAWTSGARVVAFASTTALGLLVTRWLPEREIGALALGLIATSAIEAATGIGLSRRTIQSSTLTTTQVGVAYLGDTAFGVLGTLLLASLSQPFANAYGIPEAGNYILALSPSPVLTSLANTNRNLAYRNLAFRRAATSEISSSTLATVTGLIMLLLGLGAWAVVGRELARRALYCATLWTATEWRFFTRFDRSELLRALKFSGPLMAVEILRQIATTADQLIIGYRLDARSLGIYSRAQSLVLMPMGQVTTIVATVLFPTLSRISDGEQLRDTYFRAVRGMTFVFTPVVILMCTAVEDAIRLVLGERWTAAAVFVSILGPTVLWRSTSELLRSVYNSRGRTDLTLRTTLIGQVILVGSTVLGSLWGASGTAVGVLVGSAIGTVIEQYVARAILRSSAGDFWTAVRGAVVPGSGATVAAIVCLTWMEPGAWRLVALVAVVPTCYLSLAVTTRSPALLEIRQRFQRTTPK